MSVTPSRAAALEVVTRVREREAYAHETLDAVLRAQTIDSRDAAYATRLAYGTVACRGTLDEAVSRFVVGGELEPRVSDALAVAAYELLFTRSPSHAAVSEGVELVRSVRPKAARLANAVLRRLAESAKQFPWGNPQQDLPALARLYGHPLWMAQLWSEELGWERARAVMEADNEPAPLYLAHLPFEHSFEAVVESLAVAGAEPETCELPGCIRAGVAAPAVRSKTLARRHVLVADAAAQLTAAVMGVRPGQTVVELGAGRGSKSLLMAGAARLLGGDADLLAVDLHAFKLDALREAASALGVTSIRTLVADATDPKAPGMPEPGSVDAVLVDAPCSGLGTLRRHPDRRWRARPEEVATMALLGARLLRTAAALVKPGGFVVYSTCTIASEENARVLEAFAASEDGAGFVVEPLGDAVPASWRRFSTPEGHFQSLPEVGGPDGHFIARLKRVG